MSRVVIGVIVALAAIGLVSYGLVARRARPEPVPTPSASGEFRPAPDFALEDYNGNTITLAKFRGQPLVVNTWATWCPFCWKELLDFAQVQGELGDQLAIVAINRAESLAVAKQFSDQVGFTGRLILLLDPSDSFYQAIGGFSMPETILVDREGKIVFHKRGPMKVDEIRERVTEILNPKPETLNKSQ